MDKDTIKQILGVSEKNWSKQNDNYFWLCYQYSFYELISNFNVLEGGTNKKNCSFNHIVNKDIYKWEK